VQPWYLVILSASMTSYSPPSSTIWQKLVKFEPILFEGWTLEWRWGIFGQPGV